jgi:hypothetical protein
MLLIGLVLWAVGMRMAWLSLVYFDAGGDRATKISEQLQISALVLLTVTAVVFLPIGVRRLARRRRTPLELSLQPNDLVASVVTDNLADRWEPEDDAVVPTGVYSVTKGDSSRGKPYSIRAGSDGLEFWDGSGIYLLHQVPWGDLLGVDEGYLVVEAHLQPGIRDLWREYDDLPPGQFTSVAEAGATPPDRDLELFEESYEELAGSGSGDDDNSADSDRFRTHCIWLTSKWVPQSQGRAPDGLTPHHTLVDGRLATERWVRAINKAIMPMVDEDYDPDDEPKAARKKLSATGVASPLVSEVLRFRFREDPSQAIGVGRPSGAPPDGTDTAFFVVEDFAVVDAAGRPQDTEDLDGFDPRDWHARFIAAMGRARSGAGAASTASMTSASLTAGTVSAGLVGSAPKARRRRRPVWTRVGFPTRFQVGWGALVAFATTLFVPFFAIENGSGWWEEVGGAVYTRAGICIWFTTQVLFLVLLFSSYRLGRPARPNSRLSSLGCLGESLALLSLLVLAALVGVALGIGASALPTLVCPNSPPVPLDW